MSDRRMEETERRMRNEAAASEQRLRNKAAASEQRLKKEAAELRMEADKLRNQFTNTEQRLSM